jgi:hypothetical protein
MTSPGAWLARMITYALALAALISVSTPSASASLRSEKASTALAPGGDGSAVARCPGRRIAVAGGFRGHQGPNAKSPKIVTRVSKQEGRHAWKAGGHNFGARPRTLTAFAYCGHGRRWHTEPTSKTRAIGPGGARTVRVGCATGGKPVSGGFAASDPTEIVYTSKRSRRGRWEVSALGSEGDELTAFLYCQRHAPALKAVRGETATLHYPQEISLQARCPDVVSGGFRSTVERTGGATSVAQTTGSRRPNPATWLVGGFGIGSEDSLLTAFAYCL